MKLCEFREEKFLANVSSEVLKAETVADIRGYNHTYCFKSEISREL